MAAFAQRHKVAITVRTAISQRQDVMYFPSVSLLVEHRPSTLTGQGGIEIRRQTTIFLVKCF